MRLRGRQVGSAVEIEGSHLLVAAGRTPNTDGFGLETAGIERDARDFVTVNERLQSKAEGAWASGCAGRPQFTHIAFDDFRIVRDNIPGGNRTTTGRQVPSCMCTDPELARIALNGHAAKERGFDDRLAKIPMTAVPRSRTRSEERGSLKALVATDGSRILGFTTFGVGPAR
ncbi:FAD-dependent oxidoreductase [Gemmata sp. JC673]|uniref:FAD-dependent oxidoreductase n=1 Tax=Gemmata algarum TaxID=2975278 RepID=A0ABU5EUY0_9BACT|nr:FAD-dependent oxidoreductase [Gemmata algarum]MDY3558255.1 FAD-dependent oxidoreductase [Gemmata algarum]